MLAINLFNDSKIKSVVEFTIIVRSEMHAQDFEEAIIIFAPTDGKILLNNRIKQKRVLEVSEISLSKVEAVEDINEKGKI